MPFDDNFIADIRRYRDGQDKVVGTPVVEHLLSVHNTRYCCEVLVRSLKRLYQFISGVRDREEEVSKFKEELEGGGLARIVDTYDASEAWTKGDAHGTPL